MQILRSFLFSAAALLGVVAEDVHVLTESTFDDFIKSHPKTLVEFYAPWCGHCQKMAPGYEVAATALKSKNVYLAKVDATEEKALGSRFNVKGYPTLLWFPDGLEAQEFDGGRTSEGIQEWIEMITGPAVKTVEATEEPTSKPLVTLYAPTLEESFEKFAAANRKAATALFIKSTTKKVTVHHANEEVITTTDESVISSTDKLKEFWTTNSFPLFGALDGETYSNYMSREGYGLVWSMFPMESSEDMPNVISKQRSLMTGLAKKYNGFSFTYTDTVAFKGAVENMLGVKEFPALVAFKQAGDKLKYVYNGEITESAVAAFFDGINSGKIEPTLRSEEVPAENDAPVRVVVGKTMTQEIYSAEKDVLFEVYAPWCGHCKQLDPEYEKVAKKIKKDGVDDMVMLAKMDGTANDSPVKEITWDGFPTLYYIKAGTTEPLKFDSARDAKSMWKWIKKNHSKADELVEKIKANKEVKEERDDKEEL